LIGIASGKAANDLEWSETYNTRLKSVGEGKGGKQLHSLVSALQNYL
jgi:hypothetical protein